MEKPILITATSHDAQTYLPVQRLLESSGFPVVVYRTDKVLAGEEHIVVDISDEGILSVSYDDHSIAPGDIGAAWYRKIAAFSLGDSTTDKAKQLHINNEIRVHHDAIWSLYPDEVWLNAPEKMRQADRKLGQLITAKEIGFTIPSTVVSSDWQAISSKLLVDGSQAVIKMIRGVISDEDTVKALFTTRIDQARVDELQRYTIPFPGIYQSFVEKAREWRVTVVEEDVFAAAIYTDESAKDDWRKLQQTPAVKFKKEALPTDIQQKCLDFLQTMGLRFGAFDFVETEEGEVVFLECNPNGQYGWLEEELDFPISAAIAASLVKIARS